MPPIVNQKEKRNKAFVMSTIMRDSKLAKIMNDAWNSPAGSTKNMKAKSILKSLGASHKNYSYTMDGMGGKPDMPNPLMAYTQGSVPKPSATQGAPMAQQGAPMPMQAQPMASQAAPVKQEDDPTTPNITADQVKSAFNSFGYEPDKDNMNDTGYWMTKPSTDMGKLMEELRKRRIEENTRLKEENKKVTEESRLTPVRIRQIYDSFGLGEQVQSDEDIAKIQSVLPNSEQALSRVLETEQKRKINEYKDTLIPSVKKDEKGGAGSKDGKGGPGAQTTTGNSLTDLINRQQIPYNPNTTPAIGTTPMTDSVSGYFGNNSNLQFNNTNKQNTPQYSSNNGLPALTNSQYAVNPETGLMEYVPAGISTTDIGWDRIKKSVTPAVTTGVQQQDKPGTIHEFPDGTYTYVNKDGSVHTGKQGDNYVDNTTVPVVSVASDTTGSSGEPTTPLSYGQQYTEDAITAGEGPLAFGLKLLGNKAELAKVLGMPESEIAKFWPEDSPLLAAQLPGLYAAAQKSSGLDVAEQQIINALNRNLNIEDNLSAYIRGKDEYLGEIDKLIDDSTTAFANMDTSNPYVAKQASNYMNYLTILQGRQNNRYINMLDIAVRQDNNKYKVAESQYNMAYEKAKTAYEQSAAVTTEFYNNTLGLIDEMYNNVAERDALLQDAQNKEMEQLNASISQASSLVKLIETSKSLNLPTWDLVATRYEQLEGETDEDYMNRIATIDAGMSKGTTSSKAITNWPVVETLMGVSVDNDGLVDFSNYNPSRALEATGSEGYGDFAILKRYAELTANNIEQKSSTGNFNQVLSDHANGLADMASENQQNPNNGYAEMKDAIRAGFSKGLFSFLSDKKDKLKSAIKLLLKGKTTRDEFVADYSSELGDVADLLYDVYEAQRENLTADMPISNFEGFVQALVQEMVGA